MDSHDAEEVRIESDERGFELHIDTVESGTIRFHIHGVADQLLSEVVTKIGPWMLEGMAVARERAKTPFDGDEERPVGVDPWEHYKATGDPGPVLDLADYIHDRQKTE